MKHFVFREDVLDRKSRDDVVNSSVFVTEAMLFLSFMRLIFGMTTNAKTHDLAKDEVG